ncbi:helix-turn-helix domain-containing protein [Amycolatopsis taiwanensis]|uniref:DNA-binding protein n=1 Tax=Amycolatopsis taiwanensis TaxID=342230 RepID=A0A9W6QVB5_9PSEU|nr:XRE family transcriptional regulator [Amycolatopsis taiwanensis]GLY64706.1 DNA-binding protein [Amycolatopsis taiwanensis]
MSQTSNLDVVELETRLAARLAKLRAEHGWSLDELAQHSGVSRSTLSRLERREISPTTAVLSRLCAAYRRTMSQLLAEVEPEPPQLVTADQQAVWRDESAGFLRRSVSPPHPGMRGELVEAVLQPGADLSYDEPPIPGLEHHIWVLAGVLEVTIDGRRREVRPGDCLRYRLWGPARFRCHGDEPVRYLLMTVLP